MPPGATQLRETSEVTRASEAHESIEVLLSRLRSCPDPARRAELEEAAVLAGLPLAEAVARRYTGRGLEHEDLLQVARLALVKAVRGYRAGAGCGFAAYAVPTMAGEVKRHFRDCGWCVRPPRRLQESRARLQSHEERLLHELHRMPTRSDLAESLQVTPAEVVEAQLGAAAYRAVSLEHPSAGRCTADAAGTACDDYSALEMRESLRVALATLSPRERRLLRLRFVDGLTQTEVGRALGVSQMQVSRLLSRVLRRLRSQLLDEPVSLALVGPRQSGSATLTVGTCSSR
jgi:RNA polymerase sigma-B factor